MTTKKSLNTLSVYLKVIFNLKHFKPYSIVFMFNQMRFLIENPSPASNEVTWFTVKQGFSGPKEKHGYYLVFISKDVWRVYFNSLD